MATASGNEFQFVVPDTARAVENEEFTVPCHLSPEISAVDMEIRWFKETDCVCLYKNRQMTEGRNYKDRVNLFPELEGGNVSLSLTGFAESDLGDYVCQITSGDTTEEITVRYKKATGILRAYSKLFQFSRQYPVHAKKINRTWTEEERLQMEDSALMTEKSKNPGKLKSFITEKDAKIKHLEEHNERLLTERDKLIQEKDNILLENKQAFKMRDKELETSKHQLETLRNELQEMKIQLSEQIIKLTHQEKIIQEHKQQQQQYDEEIKDLHSEVERLKNESSSHLAETSASAAPVRRKNSKEWNPPNMSGEAASVLVSGSELRLVLLGSAGSEKSSAGNIILNREKNETDTSTESHQSESRQEEVDGKQVTVVETPDWFCSGLSLEEVRRDVRRCVSLSAPGPHAFLLIIPVQQTTGVEREMLEKMEEIFGEKCWRNTLIIFTVTDEKQEMNIEGFVQNQEIQRLVQKCGNRFQRLNINKSGNASQVSELLEKIEKMVEENTERFYSSEIYLEIETQIRALERKIMRDIDERKEKEEREMKEKIKQEMQNSVRKIEGVIEEHKEDIKQLNERTNELERQMREERDEEKKKELKRELEKEVQKRTELERKITRLKEKKEKEKSEMEERHRQEMEEIRLEAERNIIHFTLPKIQRNFLDFKSKMQEDFIRQMEEKNRELETMKNNLSELSDDYFKVWGLYESAMKRNPV